MMWGSAAWDQNQLTPGVSTLAAPRPILRPAGKGESQVNLSYISGLLGVVVAWAGLLASLFLLYQEPLFGVLGMLGAMTFLLASLARVFEGSPEAATCTDD